LHDFSNFALCAYREEGITPDAKFDARKEYARALGQLGLYSEALEELLLVVTESPYDFAAAFLLRDAARKVQAEYAMNGQVCDPLTDARVANALKPSIEAYSVIQGAYQVNNYTGFKIPTQVDGGATSATAGFGSTLGGLFGSKKGTVGSGGDGKSWQPVRLTRLVTAKELTGFVERREPFIMSLGTAAALDKQLGWSTQVTLV
jgi:hypothetical protein